MYGRTVIRNLFLTGILLWIWGCIPAAYQQDDPYFSGYHRIDSSTELTAPIVDRETLRPAKRPQPTTTQPAPKEPEIPIDETYSEYTYQDWQRDRQHQDTEIYINLSYHLGGPYYYRGFQDRYWRNYMRRWHRLPWYANDWWYEDLWWDQYYWSPHYDRYHGWYDPWYSYYDPWYGYYDPWYGYYYDPFWSYSRHGYYRNHYYYGSYGWYGPNWGHFSSYGSDPGTHRTNTARTRNRADLPTSIPAGGGMTTSVRQGSAAASSSGSSSGSTARTTVRKGSSTASSSSKKSSSSGSRASKSSSSSSSKKSSSSNTARTRNRKP